jgi:hypothetical protein
LENDRGRGSGARANSRRWTVLVASVVGGLAALIAWRTMSLDGLPDIGDPFDVEVFCRPIPDESNAFVLYQQAVERLGKEPEGIISLWGSAREVDRKWLADSREAMAIWRRGTERPDALYGSPREMSYLTPSPIVQALRTFGRLSTLEGTRLETEGDFEGALGWYLANLRASRHCGTRGSVIGRLVGVALHAVATDRLTRLASNPEVGPETLRRALDAAIAIDSMTPPNSDMFKTEYLIFSNMIEDPDFLGDPAELLTPTPESWKTPIARSYFRTSRVFKKEPERSRRIFRLIIANRLAYCDLPAASRPPPAMPPPPAGTTDPPKTVLFDLYVPGASAPESARILSPDEIDRWARSSIYARDWTPSFWAIDRSLARERGNQASLLLALANGLYAREHGKPPETVEELVGPYLKALPEGYAAPK